MAIGINEWVGLDEIRKTRSLVTTARRLATDAAGNGAVGRCAAEGGKRRCRRHRCNRGTAHVFSARYDKRGLEAGCRGVVSSSSRSVGSARQAAAAPLAS
jgi:hypothetical protein